MAESIHCSNFRGVTEMVDFTRSQWFTEAIPFAVGLRIIVASECVVTVSAAMQL